MVYIMMDILSGILCFIWYSYPYSSGLHDLHWNSIISVSIQPTNTARFFVAIFGYDVVVLVRKESDITVTAHERHDFSNPRQLHCYSLLKWAEVHCMAAFGSFIHVLSGPTWWRTLNIAICAKLLTDGNSSERLIFCVNGDHDVCVHASQLNSG